MRFERGGDAPCVVDRASSDPVRGGVFEGRSDLKISFTERSSCPRAIVDAVRVVERVECRLEGGGG